VVYVKLSRIFSFERCGTPVIGPVVPMVGGERRSLQLRRPTSAHAQRSRRPSVILFHNAVFRYFFDFLTTLLPAIHQVPDAVRTTVRERERRPVEFPQLATSWVDLDDPRVCNRGRRLDFRDAEALVLRVCSREFAGAPRSPSHELRMTQVWATRRIANKFQFLFR